MTRFVWLLVLIPVMVSCGSDPEHGAWKVKSGIWLLLASFLLVAFVSRRRAS